MGTTHGAFGAGINADFNLYKCGQMECSLMLDTKYRYLFSGSERRSFDLSANGDWSRYLLVVKGDSTSLSMPGINLATLSVDVTPRSQIESWFALHYKLCNWHVEAGYNFWWRAAEQIEGNDLFPPDTGIYDLAGAVSGTPVSASRANITESAIGPNQSPSDAVFTPSTNLNFSSGSQPEAFVNGIYLAMSYSRDHIPCPLLFGVGGGYEFANRHTLSQWSLWGKAGLDY